MGIDLGDGEVKVGMTIAFGLALAAAGKVEPIHSGGRSTQYVEGCT